MEQDASTTADQARTEVAVRLIAIGRLGEHLAAGTIDSDHAIGTSDDLLNAARGWAL